MSAFRVAVAGLIFSAATLLAAPSPGQASTIDSLDVLARAHTWPTLSAGVFYRNRLWVVNSVKGRNHNSADIYSYDPTSKAFRYERHLFSQDAGDPTIHAGRLYWPYEDDRFSLGWGAFEVTDGTSWFYRSIPGRQTFHTHAMTTDGALLYASTSGWTAKLNVSRDNGRTWEQIYEHPTPTGVVSRFTSLTALNGSLIAQLVVRGNPRMTVFRDGRLNDLDRWPKGRTLFGDAVHDNRYYAAISGENGGTEIWSTDGYTSEKVDTTGLRGNVIDLGSASGALWATSAEAGNGSVWKMQADGRWQEAFRFSGGYPRQIIPTGGYIFVAGDGNDGKGRLWGTKLAMQPVKRSNSVSTNKLETKRSDPIEDWQSAAAQLDSLLDSPGRYRSGPGNLRDTVYRMATSRPPDEFFKMRLEHALPATTISLIGGQVRIAAARYARWVLLWGTGLSGEAHVPLSLVAAPWKSKSNHAEKYFDPAPAAIWAVRASRQNNRATIDTLVSRLAEETDPKWLRVQVAATLSSLTGRPFSVVPTDWASWWRGARATWPVD